MWQRQEGVQHHSMEYSMFLPPICLGHLGWHNMNRIITICVASPNVAKARRGTASQHWMFNVFAPYMPWPPWMTQHEYDYYYLCRITKRGQGKQGYSITAWNNQCFCPLICLGPLGWHNMNRIITICVASLNVAKARRGTASQHGIFNVFAPYMPWPPWMTQHE